MRVVFLFLRPSSHAVLPFLLVALALLLAGCAGRRPNQPLTQVDQTKGYYFHPNVRTNQSDDLVLALAFSGGGTRAAALAYGVLEELRDTKLIKEGQRSLIDEVDVISSVSGGSVTAAAYGLYGNRMFDVLEPAFLKNNVQRNLILQTLNPLRWPALWSSTYGRSELAADYYDKILFHGATFEALRTNNSPFVVINGTDITSGARFDFTQHSFDLICSDVSTYSIASAVAASSAVPGALTPITLENFAGSCGCDPPDWFVPALAGNHGRISRRAAVLHSYFHVTNHPYIHVVDGGVSDNVGVHPFIDYLLTIPLSPSRRKEMQQSHARKIVMISVNAYAQPDRDWDRHEAAPGSLKTAAIAAGHTLDQRSLETSDYFKDGLGRLPQMADLPPDIKLYPIFLSFTNFRDQDQQKFYLNLPTSFFLPGTDVDRLRQAGRELLRSDPRFQELLRDLGAVRDGLDTISAREEPDR
jgi:NTE family protein